MIKVKKKETKKTKKERGCDYSYLKNNFSLSFFQDNLLIIEKNKEKIILKKKKKERSSITFFFSNINKKSL